MLWLPFILLECWVFCVIYGFDTNQGAMIWILLIVVVAAEPQLDIKEMIAGRMTVPLVYSRSFSFKLMCGLFNIGYSCTMAIFLICFRLSVCFFLSCFLSNDSSKYFAVINHWICPPFFFVSFGQKNSVFFLTDNFHLDTHYRTLFKVCCSLLIESLMFRDWWAYNVVLSAKRALKCCGYICLQNIH